MGEQLVRRSWTRRGLLFSAHAVLAIAAGAAVAVAAPAAVAQTELKLADLASPETVSTWLRQHGNNADRSMAKRMFDIGARARDQRNNWGPAYKGFAESALIYPAPETLVEYANATLHGIAEMQGRDGTQGHSDAVLSQVLRLLTSAQAAQDVLGTLGTARVRRLRANIACLSGHLRQQAAVGPCGPVEAYQMAYERGVRGRAK
jgi:hypothetical protein